MILVNTPLYFLLGGRRKVMERGTALPSGRSRGLFKALGTFYKTLAHIPDGQRGWIKPAKRNEDSIHIVLLRAVQLQRSGVRPGPVLRFVIALGMFSTCRI